MLLRLRLLLHLPTRNNYFQLYKTIYLGYGGLLRDLRLYRKLETRAGSLTWMGFGTEQPETSVSISSQVLLHRSHTLFSDCSQNATFH